jgi:hypothetical protein
LDTINQNLDIMKILKLSFLAALVLSMSLFTGCKDDDDNTDVSAFVGNYVITKAALNAVVPSIVSNEIGPVPIPPGTDITPLIMEALLSQVDCDAAAKSWVELRADKSMYMSCAGANAMNAGTWEEVSATELKLNMNSAAIPTSPTGFVLNVKNIVVAGNNMTGNTSVPLPKDMAAAILASLQLSLADGNPDMFMIDFAITFVKQ